MVTAAWGGAGDADVVALLVDARKGLDEENEAILDRLAEVEGAARCSILNKIDTVETDEPARPDAETINARLRLRRDLHDLGPARPRRSTGCARSSAELMPPGPWLYPEDQITDAPLRSFAAEITREKMFERLHDELPYQTTVETDSWKDLPDGSARIEQTIYVTRDGHKKIVIGEGGQTIKSIGTAARKEIAEAAEATVHLFLFVKVRENWGDDPERYPRDGARVSAQQA